MISVKNTEKKSWKRKFSKVQQSKIDKFNRSNKLLINHHKDAFQIKTNNKDKVSNLNNDIYKYQTKHKMNLYSERSLNKDMEKELPLYFKTLESKTKDYTEVLMNPLTPKTKFKNQKFKVMDPGIRNYYEFFNIRVK